MPGLAAARPAKPVAAIVAIATRTSKRSVRMPLIPAANGRDPKKARDHIAVSQPRIASGVRYCIRAVNDVIRVCPRFG